MSWFSNTKFFSACCFQVELQCSPINSRKIAIFHALQVSLQVPPRRRAPVNGEHALAVEPELGPDPGLRHAGRFRALSSPPSPSPYSCTAVAVLRISRARARRSGRLRGPPEACHPVSGRRAPARHRQHTARRSSEGSFGLVGTVAVAMSICTVYERFH
jgi:hypothetical protein